MSFVIRQTKGIDKCLAEAGLDPERLRMHISEIAPGTRAHAPHVHDAVEAFYVLQGQGTIEVGDERHTVGPNEVVILDARVPHGLENTGTTPMRYLVVITGNPQA
jgi:mannose-6-phosphate isomerase-like protein (cupin superfamily)